MASTVTEIKAKFTTMFYPDAPSATVDYLWQDAWHWAITKFRLRENEVDISLTEGVREYDLAGTMAATREAYYKPQEDPSTWQVLYGVSIDQLARVEPGWRGNDNTGDPNRYYIKAKADSDSGQRVIGFDPLPQTTTSGGYPIVTLYCVQLADLTASETVPDFVITDEWFLYEMSARYAVRQDREQTLYWEERARKELDLLQSYIKATSDDVAPTKLLSPFTNTLTRAV